MNREKETVAGISRREFVAAAAGTAAFVAAGGLAGEVSAAPPVGLEPLPWAADALEPVISAKTIDFHFGKHHKGYVDNLNKLTAGTALENEALEDIVLASSKGFGTEALFNNAAQSWNHAFYWKSLKPGGGEPSGDLLDAIKVSFGDAEKCRSELAAAAVSVFGSGWAWLVHDGGQLKIVKTSNAGTPLTAGQKPLLAVDVWEHAYYLDYQNRRADHVKAVVGKILNWDFAAANLV